MSNILSITEKFLNEDECEKIISYYKNNDSLNLSFLIEKLKKNLNENFFEKLKGFEIEISNDLQFNEYKPNKGYVDFKINDDQSKYISFIIQLNDRYEKGNQQFIYKEDNEYLQIKRESGLLVMFFSNIKQRKIPIKEGVQYTLTGFFKIKEVNQIKTII